MLKLNAAYSKKVPAEGEYTSQSYHASIEVELPDGLSQEQLNDKIHATKSATVFKQKNGQIFFCCRVRVFCEHAIIDSLKNAIGKRTRISLNL